MMTENWHEDFEDEAIVPEQFAGETESWSNEVIEGDPDPGEIRQDLVAAYHIIGNKNYAFALNRTNAKDHHYFTRDPDVNDDAFIRACGWAYEPE
jgi:hypothetical protein